MQNKFWMCIRCIGIFSMPIKFTISWSLGINKNKCRFRISWCYLFSFNSICICRCGIFAEATFPQYLFSPGFNFSRLSYIKIILLDLQLVFNWFSSFFKFHVFFSLFVLSRLAYKCTVIHKGFYTMLYMNSIQ